MKYSLPKVRNDLGRELVFLCKKRRFHKAKHHRFSFTYSCTLLWMISATTCAGFCL